MDASLRQFSPANPFCSRHMERDVFVRESNQSRHLEAASRRKLIRVRLISSDITPFYDYDGAKVTFLRQSNPRGETMGNEILGRLIGGLEFQNGSGSIFEIIQPET